MDHDSIVEDWQKHAKKNDAKNFRFLLSLKVRDYGFDPDEVAAELHEQAFESLDCTRCANCCKTMTVILDQSDIDRIAEHLGMTTQSFIETYLELNEEEQLYKIRQTPCPFLGSDNRCTIYSVRPACCREYPHTDKEGFASRKYLHANNSQQCPATFWIVEQMRARATGKGHRKG
jgi:uncharacterized protein